MLRNRLHEKDHQHMEPESNVKGKKHKTIPGLFVGLGHKGSESDLVWSPTSPLDLRMLSSLCNPFRSPRSPLHKCNKVGLSIVDALNDDATTQSGIVLQSSNSNNILSGPQMRAKSPNFGNSEILPTAHTKPSNLQMGNSDVLFENGEASLRSEPFRKTRSLSLDSGLFSSHKTTRLSGLRANSSFGDICSEIGSNQGNSPPLFIGESQNFGSTSCGKLDSIYVSIGSVNTLLGTLSLSDFEHSEEYTCVKRHGPNPKTTHIFGDCILEFHKGVLTKLSKNERKEIKSPVAEDAASSEVPFSYPSVEFLSFCYFCTKKLEGEDIYMYRGDKAFCSRTCRLEEILVDEAMEEQFAAAEESKVPEGDKCKERC